MGVWERMTSLFKRGEKTGTISELNINEAPGGSGAKRDPKKVAVKQLGSAIVTSPGNLEYSVVDLFEIIKAYNTDSYVRRAVDKYAELMFTAGWDIKGKDDAMTQYVWTRLKLMGEATGQPVEELFSDIASDLVLFGNAFLVKARQKGSTAGASGIKAVGYTGKQPIAGYFVLPPQTLRIARDLNGTVLFYEQRYGGAQPLQIQPQDVVHFYYNKQRGRAFGTPLIYTVMDDIKLLRQIEENVARLIYRNLFPLYQYKVGIDKPGFEATDDEISDIREQIRNMPMDGGIVVPERHDISVVSNNGASLDASEYLKYFRQRVFTGLGVSDVIMGIGDTANRGTADSLSAEMMDGVREFQRIFATTCTSKIINEILFEGGYDPILNPDQEVLFHFNDPEIDAKIKKENHMVQLFTQNAITHEEMRAQIGLDPVTDEGRLYFNMVTGALAEQAAQHSVNAAAGAQALKPASGTTAANNAGSNKDQPANQHGKKLSPGKPKAKASVEDDSMLQEEVQENTINVLTEASGMVTLSQELDITQYHASLNRTWDALRDDVVSMIRAGKDRDFIHSMALEMTRQSVTTSSTKFTQRAFASGVEAARREMNLPLSKTNIDYAKGAGQAVNRTKSYVDRLINDVIRLVEKTMEHENGNEKIAKSMAVFDSNKFRLAFLARTETYRAYNYGKALVAKNVGVTEAKIVYQEEACKPCKEASATINPTEIGLIDAIPPHHANCTCIIQLKPVEEV